MTVSTAQPSLSPARLRANRRNARKITGPRSDAGKARCAANAVAHGAYRLEQWLLGTLPRVGRELRQAQLARLARLRHLALLLEGAGPLPLPPPPPPGGADDGPGSTTGAGSPDAAPRAGAEKTPRDADGPPPAAASGDARRAARAARRAATPGRPAGCGRFGGGGFVSHL